MTATTTPAAGLAIEVDELAVAYDGHFVLRDVNLQVAAGDIAVIVGGSGCGKTTLLKAIIGLAQPASGRVRVLGQNALEHSELEQRIFQQRLGVLFQHGALLNSITVGENVALPLQMHTQMSGSMIRDLVMTRLNQVGLVQAVDLMPTELSGGMRKRAALARAMALDPEILFCDEPGAGLDPVTAAEVDNLLLTINEALNTTIVIVTHELLSINRLNGQLLMLDGGQMVFSGPTADARNSTLPQLRQFFNPG
jgi:phospholipid/cholesterol/gamma-HCH transport system ATP-binding protein